MTEFLNSQVTSYGYIIAIVITTVAVFSYCFGRK